MRTIILLLLFFSTQIALAESYVCEQEHWPDDVLKRVDNGKSFNINLMGVDVGPTPIYYEDGTKIILLDTGPVGGIEVIVISKKDVGYQMADVGYGYDNDRYNMECRVEP